VPPETYIITHPSQLEMQAMQERHDRLASAIEQIDLSRIAEPEPPVIPDPFSDPCMPEPLPPPEPYFPIKDWGFSPEGW
jgi:hypothetical protein